MRLDAQLASTLLSAWLLPPLLAALAAVLALVRARGRLPRVQQVSSARTAQRSSWTAEQGASQGCVAFFHPFAHGGGGGERVLWCAVSQQGLRRAPLAAGRRPSPYHILAEASESVRACQGGVGAARAGALPVLSPPEQLQTSTRTPVDAERRAGSRSTCLRASRPANRSASTARRATARRRSNSRRAMCSASMWHRRCASCRCIAPRCCSPSAGRASRCLVRQPARSQSRGRASHSSCQRCGTCAEAPTRVQ